MGIEPFRPGFPSRATVITLLVALLFVVGAIYKWVDAQGRVHYSDTPPPGREDEVVTTSPGPSDEQQAEARQRSQEAGAELAVQVCADAQVQRMTLDLQTPVYRRASGGVRVFPADLERPAEKLRLDDVIARNCSDDPSAKAA